MKKETIEKLKELARYQIIEKDGKIIFIKTEKTNGRTNKKKRTA